MKALNLGLLAALVLTLVGATVVDCQRVGRVIVETKSPLGTERCTGCHPDGREAKGRGEAASGGRAHPTIAGHPDLSKIGCVACHGGDRRRTDRHAHRPRPGEGHPPFFPRPHFQVGCARCHIIGRIKGAGQLARGQREYTEAGCVSCHQPGRARQGLAFDLRFRPARTVEYIREHLLDPTAAGGRAKMMWSLRDRTYRGRFGDSPQGEQTLDALISYLLALAESPEPYKKSWHKPALEWTGTSCGSCHHLGGKPTTGIRHGCPMLAAERSELDCRRCHGTAETSPADPKRGACPQVRAVEPVCQTCHLRPAAGR